MASTAALIGDFQDKGLDGSAQDVLSPTQDPGPHKDTHSLRIGFRSLPAVAHSPQGRVALLCQSYLVS